VVHEKSQLVYWADKVHNVTTFFGKLEGFFDPSAPSYPLATRWLRALRRAEEIFELNERSGPPEDSLMGQRVGDLLNPK
jgi:hypothetical protein